jgi:feruloyl esterase
MGHCSGGAGAYNFGQAGQAVKSAGGDSQSSQFDAKHDAVLALRKWREEGVKPGELIGAKYVDDDLNKGVSSIVCTLYYCRLKADGSTPSCFGFQVAYTRPICPWPALPVYKGGDKNKASSFKCENAY